MPVYRRKRGFVRSTTVRPYKSRIRNRWLKLFKAVVSSPSFKAKLRRVAAQRRSRLVRNFYHPSNRRGYVGYLRRKYPRVSY